MEPAAAGARRGAVRHRARPQRPAAARLHHADGRWRLPVEAKDVDQRYLAMLIAYEDRRFRSASRRRSVRASAAPAGSSSRHGRIVSGGSTLTMQVARLLAGRARAQRRRQAPPDAARAGARAQALQGRDPAPLPEARALWRQPRGRARRLARLFRQGAAAADARRGGAAGGAAAVARGAPARPRSRRPRARARNRVLDRMPSRPASSAREEADARQGRAHADRAPRVPDARPASGRRARSSAPRRAAVHRLTIDATAQASLEQLAREHAGSARADACRRRDRRRRPPHRRDPRPVGSPGYLDEARVGAVDMTSAVRSPGSTLKPLIYGLAFEAGLAHPETLIEDRPTALRHLRAEELRPDFHGTVTIREALTQSLNIPAVKVLDAVGPARLYRPADRRPASTPVLPKGAEPTLAIALGGLGLTLSDLVALYAALARGGEPVAAAVPARRRRPEAAAAGAAAAVAGGGLVRRRHPAQRAAAGQRHARPARLQDRHLLRLSRRLGGRLRRPPHDRRLGRPARRRRHAGPLRAHRRRAAAVRRLRPRCRASARRSRRRPPARCNVAGADLPPPLKRFREARETDDRGAGAYLEPAVQIAFPPDRAELEVEDGDAPASSSRPRAAPCR